MGSDPGPWTLHGGGGDPPGDLGQDLLDADNELLMLGRVSLDGAVEPGHVEVQGAEGGGLACACEGQCSGVLRGAHQITGPRSQELGSRVGL